jgi:hypothetical protein
MQLTRDVPGLSLPINKCQQVLALKYHLNIVQMNNITSTKINEVPNSSRHIRNALNLGMPRRDTICSPNWLIDA